MSPTVELWLDGCGTAIAAAAMVYVIVARLTLRWQPAEPAPWNFAPPATTILKPLRGTSRGCASACAPFVRCR